MIPNLILVRIDNIQSIISIFSRIMYIMYKLCRIPMIFNLIFISINNM